MVTGSMVILLLQKVKLPTQGHLANEQPSWDRSSGLPVLKDAAFYWASHWWGLSQHLPLLSLPKAVGKEA